MVAPRWARWSATPTAVKPSAKARTGASAPPQLADPRAWRQDIAAQLRQGRVQPVLRRLSGTWTSLGHGIETNTMSRELPGLYQRLLKDELARSSDTPTAADKQPAVR